MNLDRKSGITGLTSEEKTANDLVLAENSQVNAIGEKVHVTMDAIHTQVDSDASHFVTCLQCGGKTRLSSLAVTGGAHSNLVDINNVPLAGHPVQQDVANPIHIGIPTPLGINNRCGYCAEPLLIGVIGNIPVALTISDLATKITSTEAILADVLVTEGVAIGQYEVGSKATLQLSVNSAKAMLYGKGNPIPSQANIDEELVNLTSAGVNFEAGKKLA